MANGLIDVSDLVKLAKVLGKVEKEYQRDLYRAIGGAAEVTANKARDIAGFSNRIPGSISVRRRGLRVRISAGGDPAPHAASLEHGGIPGTFRHPVFGNREVWVDQPAHPFLTPAVEQTVDEGLALVLAAVDSALRGVSVG